MSFHIFVTSSRGCRVTQRLLFAACVPLFAGCANPLDTGAVVHRPVDRTAIDIHANGQATHQVDRTTTEAPVLDETASLPDYLQYAAINSPRMEAAFHEWQAALHRVPQVTALPDPRVTYGYFINEVETRVGPQQHRIAVAQMVPWFGKLDLRGNAAAAMADAAFDRYQAAKVEVFHEVKAAYYELYYLHRALELTQENLTLLTQFEQVARVKYQAAAARHPDIIRVQIELGRLEDRLRMLDDQGAAVSARLNAALNRPTDSPVVFPEHIEVAPLDLTDTQVFDTVRQLNPTLQALTHEIIRRRREAELAQRDSYPDVTFGIDYIVTDEAMNPAIAESGDDPMVASVSINVPIWREKYEAKEQEALANRLAAGERRQSTENALIAKAQQVLFLYRDAKRKRSLYRDTLLSKAQESLETTLTGYQNGSISFLDLIDAERVLLDFQLTEVRAEVDCAQQLAQLEVLVGGSLVPADRDEMSAQFGSTENTLTTDPDRLSKEMTP